MYVLVLRRYLYLNVLHFFVFVAKYNRNSKDLQLYLNMCIYIVGKASFLGKKALKLNLFKTEIVSGMLLNLKSA